MKEKSPETFEYITSDDDLFQKACTKLFSEGKNVKQAVRELNTEGYPLINYHMLKRFKKEAPDRYTDFQHKSKTFLESFDKTAELHEEATNKLKAFIDRMEKEKQDYKFISGLNTLKEYLSLSLKELGRLRQSIEATRLEMHRSKDSVVVTIKRAQLAWFDEMDPIYEEGKLVLRKPKPELVSDYQKWRIQKRIKERAENEKSG